MGNYNEEFRKKIVKLHLENGRSIQSLSDEFNISKSGISNWVKNTVKNAKQIPKPRRNMI